MLTQQVQVRGLSGWKAHFHGIRTAVVLLCCFLIRLADPPAAHALHALLPLVQIAMGSWHVQVQILDLYPRKNPKTGKTYGSNAAAWWGYQFRTPFKTGVVLAVCAMNQKAASASGRYDTKVAHCSMHIGATVCKHRGAACMGHADTTTLMGHGDRGADT